MMTIDLDKLILIAAGNLDKLTSVITCNLGRYIIGLSKYMEEMVTFCAKKTDKLIIKHYDKRTI